MDLYKVNDKWFVVAKDIEDAKKAVGHLTDNIYDVESICPVHAIALNKQLKLLTYYEADLKITNGTATPIDTFIGCYEPAGDNDEKQFRMQLALVIKYVCNEFGGVNVKVKNEEQ